MSDVHNDLGNLVLGHAYLFFFLLLRLCGFAPLRESLYSAGTKVA
jgi:hypothetical protein